MLRNIIIAIILFTGLTSFAQQAKKGPGKTAIAATPQVDYHAKGAPMPEILLITFDSIRTKGLFRKKKMIPLLISGKELENNANIFVMLFNPTCGHCEDQTDLFEKNMALFKKTKLVLMANKIMQPYLPDFIRNHHVKEYPKITIGMDSLDFINRTTLYSSLPQINIYSPDRKLIRTFCGDVSIDTLRQYIQ